MGQGGWWEAVGRGRIATTTWDGEIVRVYWGSMRDWPEFTLRTGSGEEESFTRLGDVRRYVPELRVRVTAVQHSYKPQVQLTASRLVLTIDVESSDRRSSGVAPGLLWNPDADVPALAAFRLDGRTGVTLDAVGFLYQADPHPGDHSYELEVEILDQRRRRRLLAELDDIQTAAITQQQQVSLMNETDWLVDRWRQTWSNARTAPRRLEYFVNTVDNLAVFEYGYIISGRCSEVLRGPADASAPR